MPPRPRPAAWVRMPSGTRLDLLEPTPFDWHDEDLALRMGRTFSWGGNSIWPEALSVAQHSLLVLALREREVVLSAPQALRELLHDAEEGLLGFDAIAPAKSFLGPEFARLNARLSQAIAVRYGLPAWREEEWKAHKRIDVLAAASEAVHVAGWTRDEVRAVLRIRVKPLDGDPLLARYGGVAWAPWPTAVAAERFLTRLHELCTSNLAGG